MYIVILCSGGESVVPHTKRKKRHLFLWCLILGILAELSFFHGRIGLSYLVFITAFYFVLFLYFRFSFEHRRIGLLLMIGIWILAGSYLFYDSTVFNILNLFLIPFIVFFQVVLITSPGNLNWSKLSFVRLVTGKFIDILNYLIKYLKVTAAKLLQKNKGEKIYRQVLLGILAAAPILFVVVNLLIAADQKFQEIIGMLAFFQLKFNLFEMMIRAGIMITAALFFFCVFQVLRKRIKRKIEVDGFSGQKSVPGVIAATILVLLNTVYFLFIAVQFSYFFPDGLMEGYTYAEYARRGFFELILVTIINWVILLLFIKRVKTESKGLERLIKILLSVLITESSMLLLSAYQRLNLYEAAYGYTVSRLLAYSFILFLLVIFAYTLIRVWLENLSILHFYLITGFIFYTVLNAINMEEIIVNNNLARFEQEEKIDIYYLNRLGAEGTKGLITIYEENPDYPELKRLLQDEKELLQDDASWQEFNFTREEIKRQLAELEL